MQTEVVLSTIEAKYITLSQSTRDLLLIKTMIEYLNKFIKIDSKEINTYSTLFEDNAGIIQLVTELKYRPRTIYISVKYKNGNKIQFLRQYTTWQRNW